MKSVSAHVYSAKRTVIASGDEVNAKSLRRCKMRKLHLVFVVTVVLFGLILMDKAVAAEKSDNQTRLLFPFVTNQFGLDTAIIIANTTLDPFGTPLMQGTCTIHYFGTTFGGSIPPQTTAVIHAGETVTFAISQGGVPGAASSAAGFQGYMIAVCDFPLAHGFYLVSDVAVSRGMASGQALVLPSKRKTSVVESRGQ